VGILLSLFRSLDVHKQEGLYVWADVRGEPGCICGVRSRSTDVTRMLPVFYVHSTKFT